MLFPCSLTSVPFSWRREGDSNPRYTFLSIHTISSRAPSAARASLRFRGQGIGIRKNSLCPTPIPCSLIPVPCHWRREGDSNPRESFWPPNRFRVDPVMTTSVSLRRIYSDYGLIFNTILFSRKNLLKISAHASFFTPPLNSTE